MSMQANSHRDRKVFALAISPGLILLTLLLFLSSRNPFGDRRFTLFDDAMISMDYGRTLFKTGSFVWFRAHPESRELQILSGHYGWD